MTQALLISTLLIPFLAGALILCLPKRRSGIYALLVAAANFLLCVLLFRKELSCTFPWAGSGIDLSLRLYQFSGFIILAVAFFSLLICLYSLNFLKGKDNEKLFYSYLLISLSFVNGAVLANNLVALLFFWEGLLLTLYGLIALGGRGAFKTATKALVIVGVSDLCMMAGVILTGHLAKTMVLQDIRLPVHALGSVAFILLTIGAISKAGSMPFHTWIPDAAEDAPLPFMAFFPAAIEKLLGIYFLTRITLDMFTLDRHSPLSLVLMGLGALTILLAVMMALVQKNYKRLLSYHAISQVGYMILGIGTCLPAGIIGGIFHMLNNAVYKCGLFLTGGAVEKETGTADLEKLGGMGAKMPLTFLCFLITAASISGVPPFNGFFSKELIYDAALERGAIFYIAALLGSFFTAASFLKLGHAVFMDKPRQEHKNAKESSLSMLIPMIVLALACALFGVFNRPLVQHFIQPVLGGGAEGQMQPSLMLVAATVLVLLAAVIHHYLAAKIKGSGLKAADHIHHAPLLSVLYAGAERKYFDPYEIGVKLVSGIARVLWGLDRAIDWFYNTLAVRTTCVFSRGIRRAHSGYYVTYVIWSLLGALGVMWAIKP